MNTRPTSSPAPSALPRRLGTLAALGAALLMLPPPARAACQVETLELPVRMVGSRAVATVGINGTQVPLTVDTGAFFSILTDAAAAQLKLRVNQNLRLRVEGLTGGVDAATTLVETLRLFKGDIRQVQFIVGGNEPGAGTMGLMGRNLLSFTDAEYDLPHGVIRFLFPNDDCARANMAYWAGATPVTEVDLLQDVRQPKTPSIRTEVKLNGKSLTALFDTGATTIVSERAARTAGIAESAMTPAGSMYGAGRGSAKLFTASFDTFVIGNEAISPTRLRVADLDLRGADLLIGVDFFLSHRIYVSKQQSKMFFTYTGGPAFALDRTESPARIGFDTDPPASGAQPATATADQYARRGAAAAARGDFDGALADLDRACDLEPASAAFLAERGALLETMKQPAKALEDFDRALTLDPAQADARARRAGLRFMLKQPQGAKDDLDRLDETLAGPAQLRLSMAQLYLRLDAPAQALAQFNQWLPAHPHEVRRPIAMRERCWARLRLGIETDAALDDCNDAVDAEPDNPDSLDSRGWVLLRLGKFAKAVADFDRALVARPKIAIALYGRGLARSRLGDVAQGEADLAAARVVQPDIDATLARLGLGSAPTTASK